MESERSRLQSELDGALLNAVMAAEDKVAAGHVRKALAEEVPGAEIGGVRVSTKASSFTASATARIRVKNYMGGLLKQPATEISVRASVSAPMTFSELRFAPSHAGGTYGKTMSLMVMERGETIPKKLGEMRYTPDCYSCTNGRLLLDDNLKGWVDVSKAERVWLEMEIDPASKYIEYVPFRRLSTEDPDYSHHLFVEGKQMPKGVVLRIDDIAGCGETLQHAWEDGGDFSHQDFHYEMSGKCRTISKTQLHISS